MKITAFSCKPRIFRDFSTEFYCKIAFSRRILKLERNRALQHPRSRFPSEIALRDTRKAASRVKPRSATPAKPLSFRRKLSKSAAKSCKMRNFRGFPTAFYRKSQNPTFIITQSPQKINREACTFFSSGQFHRSSRFSRKQPPKRPQRPLREAVPPLRKGLRRSCKRRR